MHWTKYAFIMVAALVFVSSASASPVEMNLFPQRASACPSNTAVYELAIENTGPVKDTYTFSSTNPEEITIAPSQVTLESGEQWQDPFVWYTPKTTTQPGTYDFTIYATSKTTGERFSITGTIEVLPCHNINVEQVNPDARLCVGESKQVAVSVENTGRSTETIKLTTNRGQLSSSQLTLEPGTSDRVRLTVQGDSVGTKEAVVTARSTTSFARAEKVISTQVENCYDSTVDITPQQQDICVSKAGTFDVVVSNTGTKTDTFQLKSSGGQLEERKFTIDAGDSVETELTFTPSTKKRFNLNVEAEGQSTSMDSFTVRGKGCRDVTVIATPSEQTMCENEEEEYDVTVKNTGGVADTYSLTSNIGALGATKVQLDPDEEDVIDLEVDAKKLTQGTHAIKTRATSLNDNTVRDFSEVQTTIDNCYDLDMNIRQSREQIGKGGKILFESTLENTGSRENTYDLTVTAPPWVSLRPHEATLAPGEKKTAFLHAAAPYNVTGTFNVKLTATDKSGTVKKFEQFTLQVGKDTITGDVPQKERKSLRDVLSSVWQSLRGGLQGIGGIEAPLGLLIAAIVGVLIVLLIVWRSI